jgi:chemotaxis protein methyltransferase CheR
MAFTFFFRDLEILKSLLDHALPALLGQCHIRIWDAGCAHGPEAYTIAMLLRERMSEFLFRNVKIFATDVDPLFNDNIASGIYPMEELKRIPADMLKRYFQAADKPEHMRIIPEIRSSVHFTCHDLLSLKPIREELSLVVCKNVLLHLNEYQRRLVLRMFHAALRKDGMLAMEHTQKMPEELLPYFQLAAPDNHVYIKTEVPAAADSRDNSGAVWRADPPMDSCQSLMIRSSKCQGANNGK